MPDSITEDLAEEVGIHIGDGNLSKTKDKFGWDGYRYRIDGNLTDELIYHNDFIKPLMKRLYNCEGFQIVNKNRNSVQSNFRSKLIFYYKNNVLGLPIGSKINVGIPNAIIKDDEFSKRCLVGIIDTDFNLSNGRYLNGTLTSLKVIKQMNKILEKLNISHSCKINEGVGCINIRKSGSIQLLEEWRLHNQKHISKYQIWKEFKKFFPFTHTEERLAVLAGKLCIEELELISKKRKTDSLDKKTLPVKRALLF